MQQEVTESTVSMLEYEIEMMQTHARAEASFAMVALDEPNPWKGSRAKLTRLEQQREQVRAREEGFALVRKLAHYRTLIGQLDTDSALLVQAKTSLEEFQRPHQDLIARWQRAPYAAREENIGHAFESYRQWLVTTRDARAYHEYPGQNWPPEILFDNNERNVIRTWLELNGSVEVAETMVSNLRSAINDHVRLNPELRVLAQD